MTSLKKREIMNSSPLVTIVVPTFNQGDYLPACIDHCLFQTYDNLEIIIVDGGSADQTKKYLSQLKKEIQCTTLSPVVLMSANGDVRREETIVYPQNRTVHIISFEKDIGATRTYNEGLKRAEGKYCTYIVGDDLPHPHMIEDLVSTIESTGANFVYSDMNLVDDDGRIIRQMRQPDYDFKICFADWFHIGVSKLYQTELHKKVGLMDEAYTAANDYDQYLRFAMSGCRFHHASKILYSIRWHGPDRKTGQHRADRYQVLMDESVKCATRAREYLHGEGR